MMEFQRAQLELNEVAVAFSEAVKTRDKARGYLETRFGDARIPFKDQLERTQVAMDAAEIRLRTCAVQYAKAVQELFFHRIESQE